jgi:N-acetylglutamate synthase-like GNAT family acetyltransferase
VKIAIRRATEADADAIYNMLYFQALDSYPGADGFDADKADAMIRGLIGTTLVADGDGQIVGVLMMSVDEPWYSRDRFMRDIVYFVQPDARASSAGMRLFRAALRSAKKASLPLVLQHTSGQDILRKDKLYRRMGGRQLGSVFIFEG